MARKTWFDKLLDIIKKLLNINTEEETEVDPNGNVAVKPDSTVVYVDGNKQDKGPEIHIDNWNGLNIRLYNNANVVRKAGVPSSLAWYPIDIATIPSDTFSYSKGANGVLVVKGKDFVSTKAGQRYRFEGIHIGTSESDPFMKLSTYNIPTNLQRGALIFCWCAVK